MVVCPTIKPFSLGAAKWQSGCGIGIGICMCVCVCMCDVRLQLISHHCIWFRVIAMHNSDLAVQRFVKRYNALMSRHVREIGGRQLI